MNNSPKKLLLWITLFLVVVASFGSGIYFGYNNRPEVSKITALLNKETPMNQSEIDFDPFWKTWNTIESKYVGKDGVDRQSMFWGAISGLVDSLDDPYSVFFPPKEAEIFQDNVKGEFGGVGMEIGMRDNVLTVISPLKGTPAYRAGIQAGDKILKVDGALIADLSVDEAVMIIRGKVGTVVSLTILREDEEDPIEIKITRDIIEIPVLDTEAKGDIFIIRLYNFSARSGVAFQNALREMLSLNYSKLIIDLRGNPGGYLEMAVDISSWFLPTGEIVAREQFGSGEEVLYRSKGYNIFNNLPLVILANKGSASASEIMAGALREHGKAKLVGEKTFGKGSVQELIDIEKGSSLKLTIAKWLTPNGNQISDNGLEPDVTVELTREDFDAGRDPQLDKAIEILNNW